MVVVHRCHVMATTSLSTDSKTISAAATQRTRDILRRRPNIDPTLVQRIVFAG